MGSNDPVLAYTVHHKSKIYSAGTSASEIGEDAGEIGDHAWVDGVGPGKDDDDKDDGPTVGTPVGRPPASMSALPTPAPRAEPADDDGAKADPDSGGANTKKNLGRRSGS